MWCSYIECNSYIVKNNIYMCVFLGTSSISHHNGFHDEAHWEGATFVHTSNPLLKDCIQLKCVSAFSFRGKAVLWITTMCYARLYTDKKIDTGFGERDKKTNVEKSRCLCLALVTNLLCWGSTQPPGPNCIFLCNPLVGLSLSAIHLFFISLVIQGIRIVLFQDALATHQLFLGAFQWITIS